MDMLFSVRYFISPLNAAIVTLKTLLVTENGFVSIHPEHRMKYNGVLRKNYRSTLITYVENLRDIDG